MAITLSLPEARRLAVASQGFGRRPSTPTVGRLRKLASRLQAFQIDSVNVLVRAHYLPAFARLGPYPMDALDSLAYRKRELFEYWGHAACLLPISLYPLMRYRMHAAQTQEYMASEPGAALAKVYAEVAEHGPITAAELSNPGKRSGNWWGWSSGKAMIEHLYDSGLVAIAGRRGFDRLYDLAERVIPQSALDAPVPPREEAMKRLICLGAKASGVGTFRDITGYFTTDGWRDRLAPGPRWERPEGSAGARPKPIAKRLVAELVEEERLLAAQVDGWREPAYIHPGTRVPRSVDARALVSPFDSLVWAIDDPTGAARGTNGGQGPAPRSRVERLFGMRYTLEIYVPPPKRVYGYYVVPFLLGDTLVARCDLKTDRQRKVLMVRSAFLEPGQDARRVVSELAGELSRMQAWLELDQIEVAERGDLAAELLRRVRARQTK
jgi:uncharacterized protein